MNYVPSITFRHTNPFRSGSLSHNQCFPPFSVSLLLLLFGLPFTCSCASRAADAWSGAKFSRFLIFTVLARLICPPPMCSSAVANLNSMLFCCQIRQLLCHYRNFFLSNMVPPMSGSFHFTVLSRNPICTDRYTLLHLQSDMLYQVLCDSTNAKDGRRCSPGRTRHRRYSKVSSSEFGQG